MIRRTLAVLLSLSATAHASPPVASYLFPAGGQRGTNVEMRVGGLFLHHECHWEVLGPGVTASPKLKSIPTRWFEGPVLPLPDSQRQEDYPKDMGGSLALAADAPLGSRFVRLWTSQGATSSLKFIVGDLPEVVEDERPGAAAPVKVTMPVTINGRIFPHHDVDVWTVFAKKGQKITAEVHANRFGSPLDARLEVRDPAGKRLAENDDFTGGDPLVTFTAPADSLYEIRIQDTGNLGSQAHVYRLSVTAGAPAGLPFPLGGKRDTPLSLELAGAKVQVALAKSSGWHDVAGRRVLLDVDELPEAFEAQKLTLPGVVNGRISKPGEVDAWKFAAKKGESWTVEMRAARLGSKLDGVLVIVDDAGKNVVQAETAGKELDPTLTFSAPKDGDYELQVKHRFRSQAGPDFSYRVRLSVADGPDFRLSLLGDAITLTRGTPAKVKLGVERLRGFKDKILVEVKGLPEGVTVNPTEIKPNQNALDLVLTATDMTKVQIAHLTIEGVSGELRRTALPPTALGEAPVPNILLAVAIPTPFVIKGEYIMGFAARGGMHRRPYKIERNGFKGVIDVSLSDRQARHLQGVRAEPMTVAAGASEFTYASYLPPWMETGRTCRVCVQGAATVTDFDGTKHRVAYHSVNQNEQMVAVIGPGRLSLEIDRTALALKKGEKGAVAVRIRRSPEIKGEVRVELVFPGMQTSVLAPALMIPAGQEEGTLSLEVQMPMSAPMPTTVRATLMQQGEPVIAETPIELQPALE